MKEKISRRTALKAGSGLLATGIAGGALVAMTNPVFGDSHFQIDPPDDVSTDDGKYEYVDVATSSLVEWVGFDEPATHVDLIAEVKITNGGGAADYDQSWYEGRSYSHGIDTPGYDTWVTLYNQTIPLDAFPRLEDSEAGGTTGGSMERVSMVPHTRGIFHSGVGDGSPFLDLNDVYSIGEYDIPINNPPQPQDPDSRWPIVVHPDVDLGSLYSVPEPLVTDALEAPIDGTFNVTTVHKRATTRIYANDPSGPQAESEAEIVEEASFDVTITNIESDTEVNSADGDSDTNTNSTQTGT